MALARSGSGISCWTWDERSTYQRREVDGDQRSASDEIVGSDETFAVWREDGLSDELLEAR